MKLFGGGRDNLIVNSIMIPASLAIVTFAVQFRSELGRSIIFDSSTAGFIPLLNLILVIIPYVLWRTSTILDDVCLNRIHEIEAILDIRGNRWIREHTRCNIWIKLRRNMWHIVYWFLIGTYVFTAYWLFSHI